MQLLPEGVADPEPLVLLLPEAVLQAEEVPLALLPEVDWLGLPEAVEEADREGLKLALTEPVEVTEVQAEPEKLTEPEAELDTQAEEVMVKVAL